MAFSARFERAQIAGNHRRIGIFRHPPQRLERVADDRAQAELLGHRDLRRQQARGLDLAVQQGFEPRAEAAGIDDLDVFERQELFQPVGHVEMAAGAHADRDRHILEVLRLMDFRIRPHEDRPRREAISFRDEAAHAGAGVADRAPDAGPLDHLFLAFGVGLVLRALEIIETFPTRLRAAKGFPV